MSKKDDLEKLLFEEEVTVKDKTKILTNEEVVFMVSYLSSGDDVCSEAFFTKRFAAEIATAEAKKAEKDTWIDIIEDDNGKKIFAGTFKITKELVSMKILNKENLLKEYEEHYVDDVKKN